MRWMGGIAMLVVVAGYGCSECSEIDDCGGGFECKDGECVKKQLREPPPLPPRDGGLRDAAGTSSTADAGTPDAGPDGGDPDAGTPDVGFVDAAVPEANALVWIGENDRQGMSEFTAFGRIVDEAPATYDVTDGGTFQDGQGTSCTLTTRRLVNGAPVGFDADVIEMTLNTGATVRLESKGNGLFGLAAGDSIAEGIFGSGTTTTFSLQPSADPFSLQPFTPVTMDAPLPITPGQPPDSSPVDISSNFVWSSNTNEMMVLEVYDTGRGTVLRCDIRDDGQYIIPTGAATAYLMVSGRVDPQYIELRLDREMIVDVVAPGRGTVPVTLRTSWGPRYTLRTTN